MTEKLTYSQARKILKELVKEKGCIEVEAKAIDAASGLKHGDQIEGAYFTNWTRESISKWDRWDS